MDRKLKYYYANRDVINGNKKQARRNVGIENVIGLRKKLKTTSLADKIAKDTAQFNLKEAYKPLLESQKETSEAHMRQQQNL